MQISRPQKPSDPLEGIRNHLIGFLDGQDEDLKNQVTAFRRWYWYLCPPNWTKEDTQTQLDMLAEMPVLDHDGNVIPDTNMLKFTFEKAYQRYRYLTDWFPDAFADGRQDPQGRKSPAGVVYTEYLTPPWEYEWNKEGGITLLGESQIDFSPPPAESQESVPTP